MTIIWLFLRKSFETCFVYFATLPNQLTTIKFFRRNKRLVWKFFGSSEPNQSTIVTSFYPKSQRKGPFVDSLWKTWLFAGTTEEILAPRLSRPLTMTGRETFLALNFWTLQASRHFRPQSFWTSPASKFLDKSGLDSKLGTSPAERQVQPLSVLDKSSLESNGQV